MSMFLSVDSFTKHESVQPIVVQHVLGENKVR